MARVVHDTRPSAESDAPVSMQAYAADHLAFIRKTMERAGAFTAVSGKAQVAVGVIGLLAAWVTTGEPRPERWLTVWLVAGAGAVAAAVAGIWWKSKALGTPLVSGPNRRFVLGFAPPLVAGAVLTVVMYRLGAVQFLPGTWLLLYGAAVMAGGALSVPPVPFMGGAFMLLGILAFVAPASWGSLLLGVGFGAVHVGVGVLIAVKYGG